ncbi:hypothetical protein J1N35_024117 [Gossypium stocksii]|uniref:Uncharacterized protein n=1 Tax=Gossypium stocksii TaxID=47602 RepID=A0A9D3VK33_9ROSI|nr:hypothetical protein J1N35_024117 [Gossypium stocksii]
MATVSFSKTFADIDLDGGNQDSVPIDWDNEEIEEKNAQESLFDEQFKFVGQQLGKIANALEQFTANKTPHLYEEVMSVELKVRSIEKFGFKNFLKVEDIDTLVWCNISTNCGLEANL